MGLFNEEVVSQTREVLKEMRDSLTLTYFSQEMESEVCASASAFR